MAGGRKSCRVSFVETCCGSSDKWNRYAGLGKKMVQCFSRWRAWGEWVLGKPLTADFHPQVREENSGQSPAEDEFPNRQVGRSCHSHLTQPQNEHLATHRVGNKWPTNQALQRPSKASPHLVLGLMAAATFSILILRL